MAALKQRLARLEERIDGLPTSSCQSCHGFGQGRELLAFSDEPDNIGPAQPYDGADGTCRLCRMPPPGTHVLQLPAPITEYFFMLPWSDEPRMRFIEKLMLLKVIAEHDTQEAERAVKILHERDANGLRHWRWPEIVRHPDNALTGIHNAETDTAA